MTTHRLPTDTDNGMLLVISGPSGVGKTTITRAVERSIPDSVFSISATTRPRTGVDVEGVDYHFITDEEFDRRAAAGDFLEHAVYAGNKYGTLKGPVDAQLARGRLMILEIDLQGAKQIKARMPDAFGLFILPPSEAVLLDRLHSRRRESEDTIQKRFRIAREEIAEAKRCGVYDTFIINDDLHRAIDEALASVRDAREARARAKRERPPVR